MNMEKRYAFTPSCCPSMHWNDGTDLCVDCGADLHAGAAPPNASESVNAAASAMLVELKATEDMLLGAIPHAPRIRDLLFARLAAVRAVISQAEGRADG